MVVLLRWCYLVEELEVLPVVRGNKSMFHSLEVHNFWINRNGACPYCLSGSEAVHKSLIIDGLDRR